MRYTENTCRLCLGRITQTPINIFEEKGGTSMSDQIMSVMCILLMDAKEFPNSACLDCADFVVLVKKFFDTIQNSQSTLEKALQIRTEEAKMKAENPAQEYLYEEVEEILSPMGENGDTEEDPLHVVDQEVVAVDEEEDPVEVISDSELIEVIEGPFEDEEEGDAETHYLPEPDPDADEVIIIEQQPPQTRRPTRTIIRKVPQNTDHGNYSYPTHVRPPDSAAICDLCGKVFGSVNVLRTHLKSHHPQMVINGSF